MLLTITILKTDVTHIPNYLYWRDNNSMAVKTWPCHEVVFFIRFCLSIKVIVHSDKIRCCCLHHRLISVTDYSIYETLYLEWSAVEWNKLIAQVLDEWKNYTHVFNRSDLSIETCLALTYLVGKQFIYNPRNLENIILRVWTNVGCLFELNFRHAFFRYRKL